MRVICIIALILLPFIGQVNAICGQGYYYNRGDIPWSSVIGGTNGVMANVPNTGACADKCNNNNKCNAYEYSPSQKKCFLVKVQKPTSSGAYETYNFCSKQVCGQGYYHIKGDVPWSSVIGGRNGVMANVPNTWACADKCNNNNQCNAYEYSPSQKKCFLVKEQNPTSSDTYETYNFCSKQKGKKCFKACSTREVCDIPVKRSIPTRSFDNRELEFEHSTGASPRAFPRCETKKTCRIICLG